jgi:hypothetical protein
VVRPTVEHFHLFKGLIHNVDLMPTSFDQVHLPPHTIDSVRTIVSLPLLHPQAFQQGILKQHGMTGCLLFGPPGTGKTLVVRALAKEAGCRMIAISPSDVMDMVRATLVYRVQYSWQMHSMSVKGRNWSRPFSRLREDCHLVWFSLTK